MVKTILTIAPYIIFLVALSFAAYTDIRTKKIKIWLFPTAAIISLPCVIYTTLIEYTSFFYDFAPLLAGAAAGFCIFFFIAVIGKGGGGDAIMAGCIGLVFGITRLVEVYIICCSLVLIWTITRIMVNIIFKKNYNITQSYPLAPFVLAGYVLTLIYYMLF